MEEETPTFNLDINPTIRLNLNITTEIRDNGAWKPINSTLDFKNNPDLCRLIVEIMSMSKETAKGLKIPDNYFKFLLDSGFLLQKPIKPSGNDYSCFISDNINSLVPKNINMSLSDFSGFRLNPLIFWQENNELPAQIKESIPFSDFTTKNLPILWVEQTKTKIIVPYWFRPEHCKPVAELTKGNLSITDLPAPLLQQLVMAEILIPEFYLRKSFNEEMELIFQKAKQTLIANEYVVLREVLNPLQISALRKYYRDIEYMDFFSRDAQVPERDIIHNEPIARFIHHQLKYLINKISPEKIIPSFCYLSIYKPGSILEKHTDREQCAWNMSLHIDMQPETEVWPIYMEIEGKPFEVKLGLGDAVVYRGTQIPHWRNQLPGNQKATICFYHFVSEDFSGSLL